MILELSTNSAQLFLKSMPWEEYLNHLISACYRCCCVDPIYYVIFTQWFVMRKYSRAYIAWSVIQFSKKLPNAAGACVSSADINGTSHAETKRFVCGNCCKYRDCPNLFHEVILRFLFNDRANGTRLWITVLCWKTASPLQVLKLRLKRLLSVIITSCTMRVWKSLLPPIFASGESWPF